MPNELNELACFGWSRRAWARPWFAWRETQAVQRVPKALEIGAGAHSSLTPMMLRGANEVDCSYFDTTQLVFIQALHQRMLSAQDLACVLYSQRDVRELAGRWDLIVMKSVLGGVFRRRSSQGTELHALIGKLVDENLNPGGWLVTLDNGRTALEPLWARFGARRNGWRFLRHDEFPMADAFHSFGVLSGFSSATRLGRMGHFIDDALYALDCVLTPWVRHRAVLLHAYQRPAA